MTLVIRDANKRAKFADPAENQDAATKKYVDDSISGKANMVSNPTTDNFASLKVMETYRIVVKSKWFCREKL